MPYTVKKVKGGFKACKKGGKKCFSKKPLTKKQAVKQIGAISSEEKRKKVKESFDELINQYLNHYLFEDVTPTAPPDPKKVQQATDAAKKAILAKAGKINPSMVAKAIKATNDAGLDPNKLTS
jgi:hypothetical protein